MTPTTLISDRPLTARLVPGKRDWPVENLEQVSNAFRGFWEGVGRAAEVGVPAPSQCHLYDDLKRQVGAVGRDGTIFKITPNGIVVVYKPPNKFERGREAFNR